MKTRELREEFTSNLQDEVLNDVLDHFEGYDDYESFFEDLRHGGCQSGLISMMIYYTDTVNFYEEHKEEINDMLYELLNDTGLNVVELFGNKWDIEDPLCLEKFNKNLLAWFAYEETAFQIERFLEELYNE